MKRSLRWLGIVVSIAALACFCLYARRSLAGHDLSRLLETGPLLATAVLTLLYMSLIPITAWAWSRLLQGMGQRAPVATTIPLMAMTQFGKYLPGNVGHHLGRALMARSQGMGMPSTLASMAYETVLVVLASAHVGALTLLWSTPAGMQDWPFMAHREVVFVALTLGIVATLAFAPRAARAISRLRGNTEAAPYSSLQPGWATAFACYLAYVLNFLLMGIGLLLVARTLAPEAAGLPLFVLLTGAFASSWILGFFAPGAPAGLGVREAALAFWLHGALGAPAAVALIVALRIATTLGDLLNFAWGSAWMNRTLSSR